MSNTQVKETVENQKTRARFVLPVRKDIGESWRVAQHRKFPRLLTRTQKRRLLRERAAAKKNESTQLESNVVFVAPVTDSRVRSKSKFNRSATDNKLVDEDKYLLSEEDDQGRKTIDFVVGKFHISVDTATGVVIWPGKFKHLQEEPRKAVPSESRQKIDAANSPKGAHE